MEPVCLLSVLRTLIDRVVFATCISGEDVSGVAQDLEGLPAFCLLKAGAPKPCGRAHYRFPIIAPIIPGSV